MCIVWVGVCTCTCVCSPLQIGVCVPTVTCTFLRADCMHPLCFAFEGLSLYVPLHKPATQTVVLAGDFGVWPHVVTERKLPQTPFL